WSGIPQNTDTESSIPSPLSPTTSSLTHFIQLQSSMRQRPCVNLPPASTNGLKPSGTAASGFVSAACVCPAASGALPASPASAADVPASVSGPALQPATASAAAAITQDVFSIIGTRAKNLPAG